MTGTWPERDERQQLDLGALLDQRILRNGLLELRVGDDDLACVDVRGVDAQFAEGGGDDAAGEALAVADDQVADARGEFEDGREAAQNFVERVEFLLDEFGQIGGGGGVFDQRGGGFVVALAQLGADGQRAFAVAFFAAGGGAQQRVGDLGHGADDDDGLLAEGDAPGNDGRGAGDGGGVFDRGAAELHDYEAHWNFLKVVSVHSSQFSGYLPVICGLFVEKTLNRSIRTFLFQQGLKPSLVLWHFRHD